MHAPMRPLSSLTYTFLIQRDSPQPKYFSTKLPMIVP